MSLRYIVPTVGLLAAAAGPATAADVGGLTIDGYVDAILEYADSAADGVEDAEIDFSAFAQLEVGYAIGDAIDANIEVGFDEGTGAANLEQAYVNWAINEQFSLGMGRYHSFLGWEGHDAPELYRVNNSILYWPGTFGNMFDGTGNTGEGGLWGGDDAITGVALNIVPSEQFSLGIYIVDHIWGDAADRATDAFSLGARGDFKLDGIGTFGAALALGTEEMPAGLGYGENEDILDINLIAEIDALKEDMGLLFAADIHIFDYDTSDGMAVMLMANYALGTDIPMSASLFLTHFEPNSDNDDDEAMEIAAALLTNPTSDENFSLNVELRSISRDDTVNTDSEFGLYVELLAVIP